MNTNNKPQPVRLDRQQYEKPEFKAMVDRNVRQWRRQRNLPNQVRFHHTLGDHLKEVKP